MNIYNVHKVKNFKQSDKMGLLEYTEDGSVQSTNGHAIVNIPTLTSHLTNDSNFITSGATTAKSERLTTSTVGTETTPVYFSDGIPVACKYNLNTSVPADAKFTDTTYSNATQNSAGLMSASDKSKLDGIQNGADSVSFTRNLTSGTKIGTITINGTGTDLYCETNTDTTYSNATTSSAGLMSASDKVKLDNLTDTNNYLTEVSGNGNGNVIFKRSGLGDLTWNSTHSHDYLALTGGTVNGSITAKGGFFDTSDETLKDFGSDIEIDFNKLKNIPKKYFTWKDDENKEMQIGTSAQEVEKVYPELVITNENGKKHVSYNKLVIPALKAIDELHEENQELRARLEKLEKLVEKLMK